MTHSLHTIIRMLLTLPLLLALLCSCGSDWDGTWVSQNDPATKIRFSGENVRLIYEDFEMDGTWETDDKGNLIFELTDSSGAAKRKPRASTVATLGAVVRRSISLMAWPKASLSCKKGSTSMKSIPGLGKSR